MSIASLVSTAWHWTLRKGENPQSVLSATSGGYNSLCFPASQPYSYAGSASTRVRRLLSPTRLHKRYDISSSFSSFVVTRSEEHTSELQSRLHLVCRLLLENKKTHISP